MNRFFLLACLVLFPWLSAQSADDGGKHEFLDMPKDLVSLNSVDGKRLLRESTANEAFWALSQFYITQPDSGSCSVASSIMVLNALGIDRPMSKPHGEYRLFTPANFFTTAVEAIRPRDKVSTSGMTLDQLAEVLATYSVDAVSRHATPEGLDAFRAMLGKTLQRSDKFIIVNYLRKALGQQTGGHISPLGAYNTEQDMVLILDVSNYKYPWTWVKVDELWHAMETVDEDSQTSRGYVVVSAKVKP